MTQKNIDVMDIIVNKMVRGDRLSKALGDVYHKRNVLIPYDEAWMTTSVMNLGLSPRAANALMRAKLTTLSDVVTFCDQHYTITEIANLGRTSGLEIFEAVLDYCWKRMTEKERTIFLIETIERNEEFLREEII